MKRGTRIFAAATLSLVMGSGVATLSAKGWKDKDGGDQDHKVAICHGTASKKNPYVLIHVDRSAIQGHFDGTAPGHGKNNAPDFLAVNDSCDTPPDSIIDPNPNS